VADSPLVQWFCGIGEFGAIRAPSKSTIDHYGRWIDPEAMKPLTQRFIDAAVAPINNEGSHPLNVCAAFSLCFLSFSGLLFYLNDLFKFWGALHGIFQMS
jgi:hypothetical protein